MKMLLSRCRFLLFFFALCSSSGVITSSAQEQVLDAVAPENENVAPGTAADEQTAPADAAAPAQAVPQYRYWTTNWTFEDINIGTLLGRLRRFGIDIPVNAAGDVSLNFSVSVPLNALRTGEAYRFAGNLRSNRLQLEQLQLTNLSTAVNYHAGTLALQNLTAQWSDLGGERQIAVRNTAGSLSGEASLALVPRGDLTASLSATRLAIRPLYDFFLKISENEGAPVVEGMLGGSVAVRAPLDTIGDLVSWNMDADLVGEDIRIDDTIPLTIQTGPLTLRQGSVQVPSFVVGSPVDDQIRMAAAVTLALLGERPFRFDVRGNDVPMRSIAKLVALGDEPAVTGQLDVDARGSGQLGEQGLEDASWNVQGRLASPQLTAFGLSLGLVEHQFEFDTKRLAITRLQQGDAPVEPDDRVVMERLSANYQIDREAYHLRDLDAAAFGGTLQGSARLARSQLDSHQINLRWEDLQPRLDTSFLFPADVILSLQTSGEVEWVAPADAIDRPATHVGLARISVEQVMIGNENIGNAQLSLRAADGQIGLNGAGNLFGGDFQVETVTDVPTTATWWEAMPMPALEGALNELDALGELDELGELEEEIGQTQPIGAVFPAGARGVPLMGGSVGFNRINLARALRLLPIQTRRYDGSLSGSVNLDTASRDDSILAARARLTVDNFSIDRRLVSRRVYANLRVQRDVLIIDSVRGNYAGGQIDVAGRVTIPDGRGTLRIRLGAINASRGLTLFSPDAENWGAGILSGRLSIESDQSYRVRGAITVRDSEVFGIPMGTAHTSLVASAERDLSRWTLSLRSIESSIDQGRLSGNASLRSSSIRPGAFDLTSNWTARRLDFGKLLDETGGSGRSYARGNLNGNLMLNGTGIRSVVDLTGRFNAELAGSQARAIPGLISAQTYLGAFSLAGTRFEEGGIRGSIGGGVARIDDLWLLSSRLQVLASGRVFLANGYADVDAVIATGNFDVANIAVTAIAEQLAVGAALPVAAIIRINRLLSNRTLFVELRGAISDPRLRLRPFDTLRQEAGRFLVREAAATVVPFAVGGSAILNRNAR